MKIAFLGFLKIRFEYENIEELILAGKKYGVIIGDDVSILVRAKIKAGVKIDVIIHLMNFYTYHASAYFCEDILYIQMGCFTRTKEEWEADFWNNDSEFPKDSEQGIKRIEAFNKICKMTEVLNEK